MRYDIVIEGRQPNGMILGPNSLWWTEPIPVTTHGDWDKVVGKATDIRRNPEGVITAEIEFSEDYREQFEGQKLDTFIYGSEIESTSSRIKRARLHSINVAARYEPFHEK